MVNRRREVRWERMFLDELEEAFTESPIVYFPYGLCEPHGPQNTLGCDGIRAHAICCEAARAHGGIVAPAHYWHVHGLGEYAVWGHKYVGEYARRWLTCIPPWVFFRDLCYHTRTADAMGFHAALFYTGHGGPHSKDAKTLMEAIQPSVGTRLHFVSDEDDIMADPDEGVREWADHGGKGETSLLWAVEAGCVDVSRLPDSPPDGPLFAMGANAHDADRRTGQWLLRHKVEHIGARVAELKAEYDRSSPAHILCTYADVERLWEQVVRPRLAGLGSMQDDAHNRGPVPEGSVWHATWRVPDRHS